jgi:hypothetical protein
MFIEYVAPKQTPILRPSSRYSTPNLTPYQIAFVVLSILYIALCFVAWAVYKSPVIRFVTEFFLPVCGSLVHNLPCRDSILSNTNRTPRPPSPSY